MKKLKDYYVKFRELWKVPKYKGLIQLGFWFVFFFVIIVGIRMSNSNVSNSTKKETNKEVESKEEISNYTYNYQINRNDNIINIGGVFSNNNDQFYYNNQKYNYKNGLYYLNDIETTFEYPMNEFQYKNISNLIKDKQYESKTEFKDGKIKYEYIIDSTTYNTFYNKDYQTTGNILINVTKKDDNIINITLNLSEYYLDYSIYQVIIDYNNVNNINSLDN